MEYENMKEYLDNLVRIQRETSAKHEFNNRIKASVSSVNVLIYEDIDAVADEMDLPLNEKYDESDEIFPYTYSFVYEGVTFVSYSSERLGRHVPM